MVCQVLLRLHCVKKQPSPAEMYLLNFVVMSETWKAKREGTAEQLGFAISVTIFVTVGYTSSLSCCFCCQFVCLLARFLKKTYVFVDKKTITKGILFVTGKKWFYFCIDPDWTETQAFRRRTPLLWCRNTCCSISKAIMSDTFVFLSLFVCG